jgi:hypothetical protein
MTFHGLAQHKRDGHRHSQPTARPIFYDFVLLTVAVEVYMAANMHRLPKLRDFHRLRPITKVLGPSCLSKRVRADFAAGSSPASCERLDEIS